jgi:hypothetical protein
MPQSHRHVDQIDFARAKTAVLVLRDLARAGQTHTPWQLFRQAHADWEASGDALVPPAEFHGAEDVQEECAFLMDLLETLSVGGDTIDVGGDCIAVAQEAEGTPPRSWTRFCPSCVCTHQYVGRQPPEEDGPLSMPLHL